jgi:F420H(2)-dependent quinone reductase
MKKKLLIAAGTVVVVVLLALVALRVVGLDPHERRPGLWLTGQSVTAPVTDWSFSDQFQTIYVQTRAWYGLPHSVTTSVTAYNGRLYLTSVYRPGMRFPDDRLWNKNILRDPHVRLKVGDRVFDGTAALVTDPAEKDAVLDAKAKKYPRQRATDKSLVHVFRVQTG